MSKHRLIAAALLAATVAALVGVSTAGGARHATTISVMAVWTGAEQKSFEAVLAGFQKTNSGVKVKYTSGGDQMPTVLATAVQGGNPPDVAILAQPGLMKDFAKKGALKPLSFVTSTLKANFAPVWSQLGQVNGKQYGVIWKGANKSTVWYNVPAFKAAGVKPPANWPALIKAASTLKASGTNPYSIGGADGWTLTDLFENIYLRSAGPAKYDQLSTHKIKWTDPSVKTALKYMAQIIGNSGDIAGGTSGALQLDFPTSVSQVFASPSKAAMVFEGDFVAGVITSSTKAKPVSGFNVFGFPAIGKSGTVVVGGGDTAVMFKDNPATRALIKYLASPEAGTIWAKRGGFSSPNKKVPASAYPDPITRVTATALAKAPVFRFDMSDLQPASFGGTVGQGEFKIFQDFLKNPKNVNGIAASLESSAAKAYAKGK
ncbi:MAG: extracellular solute-binding protein [Actinobacteria bacterium]|nr:MAG: extracellular solute-binding protein [Actinomycetota bacterium]